MATPVRRLRGPSFRAFFDIFSNESREVEKNIQDPSSMTTGCEEVVEDSGCKEVGEDSEWLVIPDTQELPPSPLQCAGNDSCQTETVALRKTSLDSCRLCGYLNKYKLGSRGIAQWKLFKKRWFVFADTTCKLLYYSSPNDQLALGEIDISRATFTIDVLTDTKANIFQIR